MAPGVILRDSELREMLEKKGDCSLQRKKLLDLFPSFDVLSFGYLSF